MCLAPQFGVWGGKVGGYGIAYRAYHDGFRFSPGSCQGRERASNEPSRVANNCSLARVQRRSFALSFFYLFLLFPFLPISGLFSRSFPSLFRPCDSLFQRPAPNLKKARSLARSLSSPDSFSPHSQRSMTVATLTVSNLQRSLSRLAPSPNPRPSSSPAMIPVFPPSDLSGTKFNLSSDKTFPMPHISCMPVINIR